MYVNQNMRRDVAAPETPPQKTEASRLVEEGKGGKQVRFDAPAAEESGDFMSVAGARLRTGLERLANWVGSLPGRAKAAKFFSKRAEAD